MNYISENFIVFKGVSNEKRIACTTCVSWVQNTLPDGPNIISLGGLTVESGPVLKPTRSVIGVAWIDLLTIVLHSKSDLQCKQYFTQFYFRADIQFKSNKFQNIPVSQMKYQLLSQLVSIAAIQDPLSRHFYCTHLFGY